MGLHLKKTGLLLSLALLGGCRSTTTYYYPVGWSGYFDMDDHKNCEVKAKSVDVRFTQSTESEWQVTARSTGKGTLHCEEGDILIIARPTASIEIVPRSDRFEDVGKLGFDLLSRDVQGQKLKSGLEVSWTLGPGLRKADACGDFPIFGCSNAPSLTVRGDPGATWVRAKQGKLETTFEFRVVSSPLSR